MAVRHQLETIVKVTAMKRDRTSKQLNRPLFRAVWERVSWDALCKVEAHMKAVARPPKPCTGTFTITMGLPCAHLCLGPKAVTGLLPTDFHPFWYWDPAAAPIHRLLLNSLPVREAIVPRDLVLRNRNAARNAGAPYPPRTNANTGRILSVSEESSRRPPQCSACHQTGHKMNSRIYPARAETVRQRELVTRPVGPTPGPDSSITDRHETPSSTQGTEELVQAQFQAQFEEFRYR